MQRLPVFLILSVVAVNLYAFTLPEKEKAPEKTPPQTQQEKAVPGRDKPAAPVKDYKPTEKIKADSAVSFPVDI